MMLLPGPPQKEIVSTKKRATVKFGTCSSPASQLREKSLFPLNSSVLLRSATTGATTDRGALKRMSMS